jgi:hypothetical protein
MQNRDCFISLQFRKTVMMLLATIDPDGTKQRKSKRLKIRVYRSKVL